MSLLIDLAERGVLPDAVIRPGIGRLLRKRLRDVDNGDTAVNRQRQREFLSMLRQGPIAVNTTDANRQHYELPPAFFTQVLGPRLKYSCSLYPPGVTDLPRAEEAMLAETCCRAGLADGMDILELGCGWGSLTLWMAGKYPAACITAVSNSVPQREFIEAASRARGFENVRVVTADMNHFVNDDTFDRVVSVEMFEHMRNYAELLRRIACWLRPEGRLFVHIFCHRELSYFFETDGDENWMGRYFFTGGVMPSDHLLLYFNDDLIIEDHWRVNGRHYQQTCEGWLKLQDERRGQIMPILRDAYGGEAERWFQRWRIFFMSCAELFGYNHGNEWFVGHYLFRKR